MNRSDWGWTALLVVYAAFIWLRDTTWTTSSDDTIPILAAIPLFAWLGKPWNLTYDSRPASPLAMGGAIILFLAGITLNLTLLLALSWTLLVWAWLSRRVPESKLDALKKLLIILIFAFPWITLDFTAIGWWFRLSGAWVVGYLYHSFGQEVFQEGTNILINNVPFSVEVACAGLNTLQSMIIAGIAIDYLLLGNTDRYWYNLPLLIVMAWLANTIRIFILVSTALTVNVNFATGPFHYIGGWLVILLMFGLCWWIFAIQEKPTPKKTL